MTATATSPRSASQADFTFQIADVGEMELKVIGFDGREAISQLFEFRVDLACESADVDIEAPLGKSCLLEIASPNGSRFVHGMVRRFERNGQGRRDAYYSADVVPVHWLLTKRQRTRIFQLHSCSDMTAKGIIAAVLESAGIPKRTVRFALQETYTAREYVVQYRESDMDFIARLMEEEGIFYFFEHTAAGHRMVIADGGAAHVASPIDPECVYREPTGLVQPTVSLYAFSEMAAIETAAVRLKDFDFAKPGTDISTRQAGPAFTSLELYDFPGNYIEKTVGTRLAKVRLEEHQCRRRVANLCGNVRGLLPGYRFTLAEHPIAAINREYLLTHVSQRATQPQSAEDSGGGPGATYEVDLRVIPSDVSFRAPRVTPRPKIIGTQTAIVVGPAGEEIFTDRYGRVKVQFHWDLEGKYDENSSCWVRVSQGLAGGRYGMLFLPRVGQEVIVEFLEGDPDRPIIVGRVYNNDHMPPYPLPAEKTRSTIKSHSSTGGGGTNEIRFEDKAGNEQILIHAQKDLHLRALNDVVQNVVRDQHLTVDRHRHELIKQKSHSETKLDRNDKVGGKFSLDITGDHGVKVGGNYSNEATGKVYIKSTQEVVIEATAGLTLKVGGNFIKIDASGISIQGALTKINSGGAAGSGQAVALLSPEATIAAMQAEPGADKTYSATPVEIEALAPPEEGFKAAQLPPEAEKITSWVEVELVDEEGQPIPGELYELTYPDGKTRRANLDSKGQAHIGLKEPMNVKVTFPHLDAEAWERIA